MYGYIYKTTNLINGKIYIGQHKAKIFEPNVYLGSGTLFKRALNKYGEENFNCELLEKCDNQIELDEKEIFYIQNYNSTDKSIGYNLTSGGKGGSGPRSDLTKSKIREANIGKCLINDGEICFRILKEDLPEFISLGYSYGCLPYNRSDDFKEKVKKANLGKIAVRKGSEKHRVNPEDLQSYLDNGYILGWKDESEKKKYIKKTINGTGPCKYMHKNGIYKLVPESEQNNFLNNGWEFGGKCGRKKFLHKKGIKRSPETIKRLSESHKNHHLSIESEAKRKKSMIGKYGKAAGKIWINKNLKTKMIFPEEFLIYKNKGWEKGRK